MSLLNVKILNLIHVLVILFQFDSNFCKTDAISFVFKLRQNLTFI